MDDNIDFIEFARTITNNTTALQFLCGQCDDIGTIDCPSCNSNRYYIMRKGRLRCKNCKTDYNPFRTTWLGKVSINCIKWLVFIKLFDLGVSTRRAAKESGTSYPTALKVFDTIRYSILYNLSSTDKKLRGEIEADDAYFGGRRKGKRGRGSRNKTAVFGILEREGKVSISTVDDVSAESLMGETVKKVRRGSIVYTDMWKGYDSLMFCGYKHMQIDHRYKFSHGKVYINGIEGFWSFAKERLMKHHGISPKKFPLYIKEMEWRYNNRNKDTFALLVKYMLGAVN